MTLRGPVPVRHCTKETSEKIQVGGITMYLFEDGSSTDSRVGCMTLELPRGVSGPPMHWHRFHDECFFITKGTVRFVTPDGTIDASAGELMVVPPRAIHTFLNPSDTEDAEFFMTATPGYYIDYFRMMGKIAADKDKKSLPGTEHLMALFGTFPADVESEP